MKAILKSPYLLHALKNTVNPGVVRDILELIPEKRAAKQRQWDRLLLQETQNQKLQRLVRHAIRASTYYRKLANELEISSDRISTLDHLQQLPTLRPSDLTSFIDDIWIPEVMIETKLKAYISQSAGTTGLAKRVFHLDRTDYTPSATHFARCFEAWGIRIGSVIVWLSKPIEKPYIAYHTGWHLYLFLDPEDLIDCPQLLQRIGAEVIVGPPFELKRIAYAIQKHRVKTNIQKVIISYDILDNTMRNFLEKTLDCDVYEFVSMSELSCPVAWECPTHKGMHINSDYIGVEVLDIDNDTPISTGQTGELVVTDFQNWLMPLIRYRTGDLTYLSSEECGCGRVLPLLGFLEGRVTSLLKMNGRSITPRDLLNKVGFLGIGDIQIKVSPDMARVDMYYAKPPWGIELDKEAVVGIIETILGCSISGSEMVSTLEPALSGKYPTIIVKQA